MSRALETRLPDAVALEIARRTPASVAVALLSLDESGAPHVALLSYFELAEVRDDTYCWLDRTGSSVGFLIRRPACTLLFASEEGVFYVKASARLAFESEGQAVFRLDLQSVLEDRPAETEGGAGMTSGITFRLPDKVVRAKQRLKDSIIRRLSR